MLHGFQHQQNQIVWYIFKVDPMYCQSCVDGVSKALNALKCPTLSFQANFQTSQIKVYVPSQVNSGQIISALSEAGITAEQVVLNQKNDQNGKLKY